MPRSSSAKTPLLTLALAAGCFANPPTLDDDTSSSSRGTDASSSSASSTTLAPTSDATTSTTPVDTSGDPDSSGSTDDTTDGTSSSTGEMPCACAGDEIVCESFEPPFDPDAYPWGIPGGGGDPVLVGDPVHCGVQSLRTQVGTVEPYSAINRVVGTRVTAPGPHRLSAWLRIDESCLDAVTRVMQLQYPQQFGIWYQFTVWVGADLLEVRLQNHQGGTDGEVASVELPTGQWIELALELDLAPMPPRATLLLDGVVVIDDVAGPLLAENPTFAPEQTLNLGVYRDGALFGQGCTVEYDDVVLETI